MTTAVALHPLAEAPAAPPAPAPSGCPAADLLPVQREATVAFRVARALLGPVLRTLFRFEVEGRENIPTDGSNYVLIANHLNWIDSFAIVLAFPIEPRIHFMGDPTDLVRKRFQWRFVKAMGGFVPVDRSHRAGPQLFNHVQKCLDRGGVVALYPEGKYGPEEGAVLPFKKGFAHFAVRAGVPVLPVGLSGHKNLWLRKRLTMRIGAPIDTDSADVEQITAAGEAAVRGLLPAYREPRGPRLFRKLLTHLF